MLNLANSISCEYRDTTKAKVLMKNFHAPKSAHKQAGSHLNFGLAELIVKEHSNDHTYLGCALARREIPMICDEEFLVKLALGKEYDMYFQKQERV